MFDSDLLALTNDDLTVLSNRGLVKRSLKELNSNKFTYQIIENEAETIVLWSDDVKCILPATEKISDRHCTCSATNICRHLIRSILLYQQKHQELKKGNNSQTTETEVIPENEQKEEEEKEIKNISSTKPWNPAIISDTQLASYFSKATLTRYRNEFESDRVIEVIKGIKPIARIHSLAYTVRFLVEGNLDYTYCDCNETAPCRHVLYAIWAFRLLDKDKTSGIISTQKEALPIPVPLLNEIDRTLQDLLIVGIRGISTSLVGRLQRLENDCRDAELIWLAEIISELIQEYDRYTNRDARFSAVKVTELIGELCIRSDAIRNNIDTVPQLFIRGSKTDRLTEISASRLIGLGCGVQVKKQSVILTAYLQDSNSGTVVAVCQEFVNPEDRSEQPLLGELAQKALFKRVSFTNLGAGQILTKGGKRSPNYQFFPGRRQMAINPQTFEWSKLRSPLLVEEFDVLQAHLQLLPPASVCPRRLTENFYVLAVDTVESVRFSPVEQETTATLFDRQKNTIHLKFPYNSCAKAGTELLSCLKSQQIKFVAGRVYGNTSGVTIEPISVVTEEEGKTIDLTTLDCDK